MDSSSLFGPGLYIISCLVNGKVYIGQSENVLKRLGEDADQLQKKSILIVQRCKKF